MSSRCTGTARIGAAADSASRGPDSRTSVSASPRRAGPASVAPTTAARSDCVPSGTVVAVRFQANIGRAELDSWRQVSGGDDDVDPLVIRVGAKCRDGGQDDERTGRDASGDHAAGPVRPQAVDDSTQRRRIERFPQRQLGGK